MSTKIIIVFNLYTTYYLTTCVWTCVHGKDGQNILDEEIAATVAVGTSVFELGSTVSGIAAVRSG